MTANNYGIKFTGASLDRIDFGATALANTIKNISTFTLEGWIKVDAAQTSANAKFYLERQGGTGKYPRLSGCAFNNTSKGVGCLRFEFARVDGTADTNYTYMLGAYWDDYWHHVAFTVDIGTKTWIIYLDGGQVATGSVVDGGVDGALAALKVSNTTPQALIFGAGYDGTTYTYWTGKLDNVRLWNAVRSQSDILANMSDTLATPGSETNLMDEFRLSTGSGTTTTGVKNVTWSGTLKRNSVASALLWNIDRPFLGGGEVDDTPPADFVMNAPTNLSTTSFTLNWASTTDDVYVQYYELTIATDSAFISPILGYSAANLGLVLTKDITGLNPSANYYARIRALDAALNATAYATYSSNAAITTTSIGDVTAPTAPVAASASSITDTSFVANWAASVSIDETGYKLDVATDIDFQDFNTTYRNLDVANVVTYAVVTGILPSTIYYYRVRAYDAAGNESDESNIIELTTSNPPDTTAPDVVIPSTATSIASTSFTANWNIGTDNIGVTGYKLDVATDDTFVSLVSGYNNLDVGNVTSYGIVNLTASTGYYYRVRAYDAALNISANTTDPEMVSTTPSLLDEAGLLSVIFDPTEDTYVNQGSTGTNYGSDATVSIDNTGSNVKRAYFRFNLSELTGTIVNANLNIYVSNATANTIKIRKATGTWAELTLTYTNDTLSLGVPEVTFIPTTIGWYQVDIATLLDAGYTSYTIGLTSSGTDLCTIDSRSGTHVPYLEMEIDPTSTTEVQTFVVSSTNANYTNLLKNPSAEVGGTAFGGSTGITKIGAGCTLLQDATYAYEGLYSCKVVSSATIADGVTFESATGLAIAGTGQTLTAKIGGRANSSVTTLSAFIRLTYTDVSTTNGTSVVTSLNTNWTEYDLSVVATNGKTVDKVEVRVAQSDGVTHTYWLDAAAVIVNPYNSVTWDGDYNTDTDWNGTVNASTSTLAGNYLTAAATYVGDGDSDNSVAVAYRPLGTSDWISIDGLTASINRGTKQVTATIAPWYNVNRIFNPSFKANTTSWIVVTTGTMLRIDTDGNEDISDANLACLQVTTAAANAGVAVDQYITAATADLWTLSFYAKSVSGTLAVRAMLQELSTSFGSLATPTTDIAITTSWARYSYTFTIGNASTKYIVPKFLATAATASVFLIDQVQLERNSVVTPYCDGDQVGGQWAGAAYNSSSYRRLLHEVTYEARFTFTDPDGITGSNPVSTQVLTAFPPTDTTTLTTLTLTPDETDIGVVLDYSGDDNQSATFLVQYKRGDLSVWSRAVHAVDRTARQITATCSNLKAGTVYDVRVTATDTDDYVYGGVVVTTNQAYAQSQTTTTIESGLSPVGQIRITFDGFRLMDEEGGYISVAEHDAFSLPERRAQVENLPRLDGAIELSNWWGKRTIRMRGSIRGDSRADLNDRVSALRKALAPRLRRLVVDTLDSNSYYFTASCTGFGITEQGNSPRFMVPWDAEFTCADPFRYASSETSEGPVTLNDDETVTITNSGDLSIDPVFTITTTSAIDISITITNVSTGERIHPASTIKAGDKLIIDSSRLSLMKNGVEIDYDGAFPTFAVGSNQIKATTSASSIAMTTRRRHKYF